ncbi:M48 family metallopeptidase [uncultured Porphyromonas sp.]|jgi:putative peptidase M48 family|uniref:M48 family metallopeptidase n=1 Tax=uncultured Porphyromonas sp. TaxID=159274 RepID=UPI00260B2C13|nr:M48 family metallopeptidase [uncultured Porphyromonas sp.]
MKIISRSITALTCSALLLLSSCGSVPITGRRQLNLVSDGEILSASATQYKQFISQSQLSSNTTYNAKVTQVGRRLAAATNAYLKQNGYESMLSSLSWEFNVVDSKQVNAFCMPGGKIVVYTGLLNLVGNGPHSDDELAAVMGHELSHALAKHANERISNQLLLQAGGQILGAAVNTRSQLLGGLINQAYGLGAQVGVMLPFGRKQEYEADKMGLVLMAMAGYDPRYAVNFWQKMSASKGGAQQNELLSTHPSDANRIKEIQAYLPNALKYYQGGNSTQSTTTTPPPTGRSTKSSRTIRANEVGNYLRK